MYFIETKATSCIPYFGHLPFNTYLLVFCIAAQATELGIFKYINFCRFVSSQKCKLCLILYLLIVVLAINTVSKLQDSVYKNAYLLFPPKSVVNLKTGQSVYDNILPWSLYSTCSLSSRRGLVQEDKRMVLEYTHGLFIT
jgi:hypothetical protein